MRVLFFSKATHLKEVWIPGYVKGDGTVVNGFSKKVHVTDDHDDTKVANGGISASQVKAHKKLSKDDDFNSLPEKTRSGLVMSLATDDQLAATKAAQATFAKQKLVAGKTPSKSEWSALNDSDNIGHLADIHAAGRLEDYYAAHSKHGTEPRLSREDLTAKIQSHIADREQRRLERSASGSNRIDPSRDSLLTAITKLGGLDSDEAEKQGIDPAYFKKKGFKIFRIFHSKGMTFDDMAHNFLSGMGYPVSGANDLLDAIDRELLGKPVYTLEGYSNIMEEKMDNYDNNYDEYGIESPGNTYADEEYGDISAQDMAEYDLIFRLDQLSPGIYNNLIIEANENEENADQFIRRCEESLRKLTGKTGHSESSGAQESSGRSAGGPASEGTGEGGTEDVGDLTKAVVKKTVWIAGYFKKDGSYVRPHHSVVNLSPDHDPVKVASGQGKDLEKKAHAILSKQPEHNALPVEDQANNIAHYSTKLQKEATETAQVSLFKQAILDGKKPNNSQTKAFIALPESKFTELINQFDAAGKAAFAAEQIDKYYKQFTQEKPSDESVAGEKINELLGSVDDDGPATVAKWYKQHNGLAKNKNVENLEKVVKTAKDLKALLSSISGHDKMTAWKWVHGMADKDLPLVSGELAGDFEKLPDDAKFHAMKVLVDIAGKDVALNLYNTSLEKIEKPAVNLDLANDSADSLVLPVFESYDEGLNWFKNRAKSKGISMKEYTSTQEYKDVALPLLSDLYKDVEKSHDEYAKNKMNELAASGLSVGDKVSFVVPGMFMSSEEYSGVVVVKGGVPRVKLDNGEKISISKNGKVYLANSVAWQPYMKKVGPKEGDVKEGADGVLVFKDGRWHKQEGDLGAPVKVSTKYEALKLGEKIKLGETHAFQEISSALSSKYKNKYVIYDNEGYVVGAVAFGVNKQSLKDDTIELHHIGSFQKGGGTKLLDIVKDMAVKKKMPIKLLSNPGAVSFYEKNGFSQIPGQPYGLLQWVSPDQDLKNEPAAKDAQVDIGALGAVIDMLEQVKLPESNVNHKTVNKKIEALKKAALAGDVAAIEAMSFGSNTYGKKLKKVADMLAAELNWQALPESPMPVSQQSQVSSSQTPAESTDSLPTGELLGSFTNQAEGMQVKILRSGGKFAVVLTDLDSGQTAGTVLVGSYAGAVAKAKQLVNLPVDTDLDAPAAASSQADVGPKKVAEAVVTDAAQIQAAAIAAKTGEPVAVKPDGSAVTPVKSADGWDFSANDFGWSGSNVVTAKTDDGMSSLFIVDMQDGSWQVGAQNYDGDVKFENFYTVQAASAHLHKFAQAFDIKPPPASVLANLHPDFAKVGESVAVELGPKEGDTKEGADGTLIFKDGRWHKMDEPSDAPSDVPSVGQKNFVYTDEKSNKFWNVTVVGSHMITHYGKIGSKGSITEKEFSTHKDAVAAMGHIINEKMKKGYVHVPGHTEAEKQENPVEPEKPSGITDVSGWAKVGGQEGSNPGGWYKDDSGQKWYIKTPSSPDRALNEILAAKLYEAAGIKVPEVNLVMLNGKASVASKKIDGLVKNSGALKTSALLGGDVSKGFAVDAWLANWDAVGLNYDNMQKDNNGDIHRVDVGGSLLYRAQGGVKGADFGDTVPELSTLRDPDKNPKSASVFSLIPDEGIKQSAEIVAGISNETIRSICDMYAPGDKTARDAVADKLINRRDDIIKQTGVKSAGVDLSNLKVNDADLPKPHDFLNWNGPGKGLSSKHYINEANLKTEKKLYDFAKQGNLIALQDYKYMAFDKETGDLVGTKPISEHPSSHVKLYHGDLVAALDAIAYPPKPTRSFVGKVGATLTEIANKIGSHKFGSTIATVKASERLAFWIAQGVVANYEKYVPTKKISLNDDRAFKEHALQMYSKAGSLTKYFISHVQSSGSYNNYWRDGKPTDGGGESTAAIAKSVYKDAAELSEGTTCYKWISLTDAQVKQLLASEKGMVFQNPGSMCASMHPTATKGFGDHRLIMHAGVGAKAIPSFASGHYSGEKEVTTLMGQRFMIVSRKMVNDGIKNKPRLDLEVVMLPPDDGYIASMGDYK